MRRCDLRHTPYYRLSHFPHGEDSAVRRLYRRRLGPPKGGKDRRGSESAFLYRCSFLQERVVPHRSAIRMRAGLDVFSGAQTVARLSTIQWREWRGAPQEEADDAFSQKLTKLRTKSGNFSSLSCPIIG